MSTNARSWFYNEPEHNAFLIAERVNGTFWQARYMQVNWRCVQVESPFRVEGFLGDQLVAMEWIPGEWLSLIATGKADPAQLEALVEVISKRVLGQPASLTFGDSDGHTVYEWHQDDGDKRWREIQGKPVYVRPRRLTKSGK
jgi:hypothetical protein